MHNTDIFKQDALVLALRMLTVRPDTCSPEVLEVMDRLVPILKENTKDWLLPEAFELWDPVLVRR